MNKGASFLILCTIKINTKLNPIHTLLSFILIGGTLLDSSHFWMFGPFLGEDLFTPGPKYKYLNIITLHKYKQILPVKIKASHVV